MSLEINHVKGRQIALEVPKQFSSTGILGSTAMPEDLLPKGVEKGSLEHTLFITLSVTIDYQRDADQLWEAARKTYSNPSTQYLFNPEALNEVPRKQIINDLQRYSLSKKYIRDADHWRTGETEMTFRSLRRFIQAPVFLFMFTFIIVAVLQADRIEANPLDAPRGLYLLWNWVTWKTANDSSFQDNDGIMKPFVIREYHRLNSINASVMQSQVANPYRQLADFGDGNDNLQVSILTGMRKPVADDIAWDSFHDDVYDAVLKRYAQGVYTWEYATNRIDRITESIQDQLMDNPGFAGYFLLDESFAIYNDPAKGSRSLKLADYTIRKIRQRDTVNPIIISHSISWIYGSDGQYTDTLQADSVFSGDAIRDWNVFESSNYPINTVEYYHDREWWLSSSTLDALTPADAYDGWFYYYWLWRMVKKMHLRTSMKIDQYRETVTDLIGPDPEWWVTIQVYRGYLSDKHPTDPKWYLARRRPTDNEYRMQAFTGLASGARGVTVWPYISMDTSRYTPVTGNPWLFTDFNPGETDPNGADKFEREPAAFVSEGLISPDYFFQDDLSDPERDIINFRRPFSRNLENINYPDFPAEAELYDKEYIYPFDEVASMYDDLGELLPILRSLRWWWAVDGSESSFSFDDGRSPSFSFEDDRYHLNTHEQMKSNRSIDGVELKNRFSLRKITGEESSCVPNTDIYYSSIIVGMFDKVNAAESDTTEYYLIVNKRCNYAVSPQTIVDAGSQDITLWFLHNSPDTYQAETVWKDNDPISRTDLLNFQWMESMNMIRQEVRIEPGDAILIRISTAKEGIIDEFPPDKYELYPCFPNPFNSSIIIPFLLPNDGNVKISIYNILGETVRTLLNRRMNWGGHRIGWNGDDNSGVPVAAGIYFVVMETSDYQKLRKIVLIK